MIFINFVRSAPCYVITLSILASFAYSLPFVLVSLTVIIINIILVAIIDLTPRHKKGKGLDSKTFGYLHIPYLFFHCHFVCLSAWLVLCL